MNISAKHFYFIKDEYYSFANDSFLMLNKENDLKRPCFLAVRTSEDIIWMIPVSSKFDKFQKIFNKKRKNYGTCDTIVLGELLGRKCAFLIQNMFPITEKYIEGQYIQKSNNVPVAISEPTAEEIIKKFKKILALVRKGNRKLIFPDIVKIEQKLKK